jgi:tRNA-specific 2-thiouridylase
VEIQMNGAIAIALSGGIDSLVAATLLREAGHRVIGVHFLTGYEKHSGEPRRPPNASAGDPPDLSDSLADPCDDALPGPVTVPEAKTVAKSADSPEPAPRSAAMADPAAGLVAGSSSGPAADLAAGLADQLGIAVHVVDLSAEFEHHVVDYFTAAYRAGRTPNPCLVCNPTIKFHALAQKAMALGADHMATGHYARIVPGEDGRMRLLRGVDPQKDQSYFLARLTQPQLKMARLPLGDCTKARTREIARQKGLVPIVSEESQDVCFIPNGSYGDFLVNRPGFTPRPGPIVNLSGEVIGRPAGLHRFTVGQRRGINIPAAAPYYVVRLDAADHRLVVGHKADLLTARFRAVQINWIASPPTASLAVQVRVRYRHTAVPAILHPKDATSAEIAFDTPQEAVTPGQGAVFYQGEAVLGGGWIR